MKIINCSLKSKAFEYDFAVDGGAVGSILTNLWIPIKSVITRFIFVGEIDFTGAGANVAISFGGGTGLQVVPALPIASWPSVMVIPGQDMLNANIALTTAAAPGPTVGTVNNEIIVVGSAAAANVAASIDISGGALTAGKFVGIFEYYTRN